MVEKETRILASECEFCGLKMESLYPNQLSFNMAIHKNSCSGNPKNKEVKNGKTN